MGTHLEAKTREIASVGSGSGGGGRSAEQLPSKSPKLFTMRNALALWSVRDV